METIINIICNAENSFADWMIFICATFIIIGTALTIWCWVGEKFLKITHLDEKFNRWVDNANEEDE